MYKMNKREKFLMIITAGFAIFFVFYNFIIMPQLSRNQELSSKIISQRTELDFILVKVAALKSIQVQQEEKPVKAVRISDFLNFISRQSVLARLDLVSIIPKQVGVETVETEEGAEVSKGGGSNELEIEVKVKGSYLGLLEFLSSFEKGEVPAAAKAVEISKADEDGGLDMSIIFGASFYSSSGG